MQAGYHIRCLPYELFKKKTRVSRGSGTRRRVLGHLKVPKDWKSFLRHNDNKTELFEYLADYIHKNVRPVDKMIIVTSGENVFCWPVDMDDSLPAPCNHEEADYRILLHVQRCIFKI